MFLGLLRTWYPLSPGQLWREREQLPRRLPRLAPAPGINRPGEGRRKEGMAVCHSPQRTGPRHPALPGTTRVTADPPAEGRATSRLHLGAQHSVTRHARGPSPAPPAPTLCSVLPDTPFPGSTSHARPSSLFGPLLQAAEPKALPLTASSPFLRRLSLGAFTPRQLQPRLSVMLIP